MCKSNIVNMKWVSLYIMCNLAFGASVPEVVALEVARNIYIEHEDLHGRDEFSIFVAYAAPFEFDIALERGIRRWFKRRRGVEETDA